MSKGTRIERYVDEVLLGGFQDLVMASEVASIVSESTGSSTTDEDSIQTSLDVIRTLLEDRLAEVGDAVLAEGGKSVVFRPWSMSTDEALRRIEREWRRLPNGPNLGDVCWFRLTDRGRRRAEDIGRR